jgi:hypothetical protein
VRALARKFSKLKRQSHLAGEACALATPKATICWAARAANLLRAELTATS